ncbi:carbohydrate ABC transporter permease [Cypionkella sp. TWP1-2-1b2]|uniref:carbohydrate ABC transporter permease n=1 Tax=Cypionkella sp. TWP1-2-1b2 TaxID=2804675 RepID=UPI003CE67D4B
MSSRAHRTPPLLMLFAVVFTVLWLIVAVVPFAWTVWGSFKVEADFFSYTGWIDAITGRRTLEQTGGTMTLDAYRGVWITEEFWKAAVNTIVVTVSVTLISLTFGTLGGYALARSGHRYAFWILIVALLFRAMPGIALVSGYLLPFFELNLWGHLSTTIIVLVALNQPFTLWLLHSFFLSIPRDLDESALVDGCTRFQAFRLIIMPVMWPGLVTTGIFSFLVGYSDFVICATLLSETNQTMVPRIAAFLGTTQQAGRLMYAVAATVSVITPLFILVLFFQRRIVSGLTAGAVKG